MCAMSSMIDTIVTALTLQRSQIKGLIAFTVIAAVVSASYRLRSPSKSLPDITAADTIVAITPLSPPVRAVPAQVLEEILNIKLPDSVYYYYPE